MSLLSIIVPCYNEEENVSFFYMELMKVQEFFANKEIEMEILYVDDGSCDGTVSERKRPCLPDWKMRKGIIWC